MKKYLKLASLSVLIAVGLTSCEADDDGYRDDPTEIGGYATLSDRSISRFDRNSDLNINFFATEAVSVESVEIIQGGSVVGNATVSGETATFNTSILGDFTFPDDDGVDQQTGSYPIRIRTTYSNGEVSEDPFTVGVEKVISLGDNATETTMDSLSAVTLNYEVSTFSANVDDVMLELKRNSDGTFIDSDVDVATDGGSVMLSETNFADLNLGVNDTLFYKLTATSGNLTDITSGQVAITPKAFTNSNSVTLSDDLTMNQLDLATGAISGDGEDNGADIRFLDPTGFEVIDGSDVSFVKLDEDFDADVLTARAAYEDGDTITSATDLENGDIFVYKDTRDVEDEDGNIETQNFYGIFRIGSVSVVDGNAVSFDIDYSDGF
ncbi:hypothetical protein [Christiangramia forsetii]|uniref:Secreted protein n=2 Tax=Christiangramia forsetii TaxID=411153 RepID=A0M5A7_CHRFK|nr:hypothetical protein [Christiangramia forsetii]GGG21418.1 hypothetical protein GCM10011532_00550 [Christiangramia forsetii]CAL67802.1 secreted protein [Christiangramia forsetii KT0803]